MKFPVEISSGDEFKDFPVPVLADSRSVAESQSVTPSEAQESTQRSLTPRLGYSNSCGGEFNFASGGVESRNAPDVRRGHLMSSLVKDPGSAGNPKLEVAPGPIAELSSNETSTKEAYADSRLTSSKPHPILSR